MTKSKPTEEFSAEERAALLARFESSGMTLRAFAASVGIPHGTFSHWRWRSRQAHDTPPPAAPPDPTFVPVMLTTTPAAPPPRGVARYEIACPGGFVVRVGDDFEPATLRRLLATLHEVGAC